MIIYIDGKLDRDELTLDEAIALNDSPLPPLPLLFWFVLALKHEQPIGKAA